MRSIDFRRCKYNNIPHWAASIWVEHDDLFSHGAFPMLRSRKARKRIGFTKGKATPQTFVRSIKLPAKVPPGYGIVEISRLGGFDIYLSSSYSFEIAVDKGATAKGGVQRKRHKERKTASSVVFEMKNLTRGKSPCRRCREQGSGEGSDCKEIYRKVRR
jgi:hypothetical protein